MNQSLKHKTVHGVIWSSVERFANGAIMFLLGLLLARQLSPTDYGTMAMTGIFFAILSPFVDVGMGAGLIRKIDRTESDTSTVFYFNVVMGLLVTLILFLIAPLIARFFDNPMLSPIVRVISTTVFIGSLGGVQSLLLSAQIDFKSQAKITLSTNISSGLIGLWAAYNGFGVWSLVVQQMVGAVLRTILLWIIVKWRPTMPFSRESFIELFTYGWKFLASGLLDILYGNIYTLVVGKLFKASNLGDYSRANQTAQFPSSTFTGIIQRVTFPVLSHIQHDDVRLAESYRKLLRMSAFIIFPSMVGLSVLAQPFIMTVLTAKWSGAIPLLQIICFAMMWYPIHAINLNLLTVKGRSDLFLRLEIIKKIMGVSILCITVPMGLIAICWGQIVFSLLALIINTHYTGKLIGLGFYSQIKDLMPTLLASLSMGAIICFSLMFLHSEMTKLICGIVIGIASYASIVLVFRFNEVGYLREIKEIIVKK